MTFDPPQYAYFCRNQRVVDQRSIGRSKVNIGRSKVTTPPWSRRFSPDISSWKGLVSGWNMDFAWTHGAQMTTPHAWQRCTFQPVHPTLGSNTQLNFNALPSFYCELCARASTMRTMSGTSASKAQVRSACVSYLASRAPVGLKVKLCHYVKIYADVNHN